MVQHILLLSISNLFLPVKCCVSFVSRLVCPCVCLFVMTVNSGKMAHSIKLQFELVGRMGQTNHVLGVHIGTT